MDFDDLFGGGYAGNDGTNGDDGGDLFMFGGME